MKSKTADLTGSALDWAVAKCEGFLCDYEYSGALAPYSTDWSQGGPIIERGKIGLLPSGNAYYQRDGGTYYSYGPTPLIAASRCYVASKLGDEIEIPDALVIT